MECAPVMDLNVGDRSKESHGFEARRISFQIAISLTAAKADLLAIVFDIRGGTSCTTMDVVRPRRSPFFCGHCMSIKYLSSLSKS